MPPLMTTDAVPVFDVPVFDSGSVKMNRGKSPDAAETIRHGCKGARSIDLSFPEGVLAQPGDGSEDVGKDRSLVAKQIDVRDHTGPNVEHATVLVLQVVGRLDL